MSALPPIVPTKRAPVDVEITQEDLDHATQVKAARDAMIAEEMGEAERVRKLGPEPAPEITEEQLRNNPSNYQPAMENTFKAMSAATFEPTVTVANPSVVEAAATPAVVAQAEATDERQQWVCVQGDGIRSETKGAKHPVFGSDAHMVDQLVRCPQCGSMSVRKVMPGDDPDRHP